MATRSKRILFYMALAIVCYGTFSLGGGQAAFVVFLVAGAVGELLFWREVFLAARS